MSITTKTGDKGRTSLLSGERVKKHHIRIQAYGVLDELNALLGVIRSEGGDIFLETIQSDLFQLSAYLSDSSGKGDISSALSRLEAQAKDLEARLPKLTSFILPGGHPLAAKTHFARTVCRRAEREIIQIPKLPKGALPYINRLSDFLFLLARKANFDTKTDDIIWKK